MQTKYVWLTELLELKASSTCYLLNYIKGSVNYVILIYLLNAIGLTPGGSSTVHIYTQTVQGTVGWLA